MKKIAKILTSICMSAMICFGVTACKDNGEETVTVRLEAGNGQSVSPITREVGATYGKLPTPTWNYQNFLGWFSEEIGGTPVTADTVVTEETQVLYGRWTVKPMDVLTNDNKQDTSNETALVQYPLKTEEKRIAAGSANSYVIDEDGCLWGWGDNEYGQLGNGTTEDCYTPTQIMPEKRFAFVDTYNYCTFAIDTDGKLWAWGWNRGFLGDGTEEMRTTPIQLMPERRFYTMSLSGHPYAIDVDGGLWGWGSELWGIPGQLFLSPIRVQEGVRFMDVSSRSGHTLALDEYGRLWTWGGDHDKGELGVGTPADIYTKWDTSCYFKPILVKTSVRFSQVNVPSGQNSVALDVNGNLWGWGDNSKGGVGDGTTENRFSPTQITSRKKFTTLFGVNGNYALDEEGQIWHWGNTMILFEAVGETYMDIDLIPTPIMQEYRFCYVSMTTSYGMAFDKAGEIWMWGFNSEGLLNFGEATWQDIEPFKLVL